MNRDHARTLVELARRDPEGSRRAHASYASLPDRRLWLGEFELNNLRMRRPASVRTPRTVDELATMMQAAADARVPIKAVGAAFALSDIDATRGSLFHLGRHLHAVRRIDDTQGARALRPEAKGRILYEVEAGATIDQVNAVLAANGHALHNQPGFGGLSLVGVASVGGHGSGITLAGVAESLVSIRVLRFDPKGRVDRVQVEPADGITDAAKTPRPDGFSLVQDDDTFRCVAVGLGAMGIVTSVLIEARQAFRLREDRVYQPWAEVMSQLDELLTTTQSIAIWLNPYANHDGRAMCLLSTYQATEAPIGGARGEGIVHGGSNVMAELIVWWVAHCPSSLPLLMDVALETSASRDVVMPSPEALNFGPPNNLHVLASACGIDVKHTRDAGAYLMTFVDRMRARGEYVTSPLGFRFVAPGRAYLSPQYDRATCMIEMPILAGTAESVNTLDDFLEEMGERFDARPHWGQHVAWDEARIRRLYPKYEIFRRMAQSFGAAARFSNKRLAALGLTDAGPPPGTTREDLLLGESIPRWRGSLDAATSRRLTVIAVALTGLVLWGLHGSAPLLGALFRGYQGPGSDPATRPVLLPGIPFDHELLSFVFGATVMVGLPALVVKLWMRERLSDYGLGLPSWPGLKSIFVPAFLVTLVLWSSFVWGATKPELYDLYPLYRGSLAGTTLVAYECSYLLFFVALDGMLRGTLLFGLLPRKGDLESLEATLTPIAVETLVQGVWHAGKPPMEAYPSPLWGVLAGLAAVRARSVWPVVLVHWLLNVAVDLTCLASH